MDKTRVIFFFTLLAIVIAIARYNSPKKPAGQPAGTSTASVPAASASPAAVVAAAATPPPVAAASPAASASASAAADQVAKAQSSATPSAAFQKVVPKVSPAVAMISVFDESGKLLRTGTGCFVSQNGRLVTSWSVVQGAAHGVAKVSDGRIINISGILAQSSALDLAVLQADTKKGVPFLAPNKSASFEAGERVAAVGSSLHRKQPAYFEASVAGKGSDQAGEWIDTGIAVPKECIGAPLVNEKGDFIGIVTSQRQQGSASEAARKAGTVESLLAAINPSANAAWQVADLNGSLPPAEGPLTTPSPTPSKFAKIPVVQADRAGHTRLISSPKPAYPTAARHSYFPLKGNGRYRVAFDSTGQVKNVTVLESTRSDTLDQAAIDALRRWKAAPGQEWTATVPVSFQP